MNISGSLRARKLATALALLAFSAGCSKGLSQLSGDLTGSDGNSSSDAGNSGGSDNSRSWSELKSKAEGSVDGGTYSGQVVLHIDSENQALILSLPLPSIFLMSYARIQLPDLPGAEIFPDIAPDGTSQMAVRIPLKYISKGTQLRSYNTLPNGDALPFMPVGENRGFAFSFPQNPKYRLHLYMSANAAAVFVETPDFKLPDEWSILPTIGFPVKNQAKTQVLGYLAVVPNRASFASGIYVATRLPNDVAILIDELIRY